jgi:hypothetical protein
MEDHILWYAATSNCTLGFFWKIVKSNLRIMASEKKFIMIHIFYVLNDAAR